MKPEKSTRSVIDIIKDFAASEKVNLPVFPGVAFELQQLLADDNTSMDQISNVISRDQALATQVLKMANSVLFSGPYKVRTVRDATMRLGLNHVFNLVVCTSQQKLYKSRNPILNKYLQVSWKHALCTAVGSKWLVQELGYRELRDEAFLAGLLHDIGKLVLIKVFDAMNSQNEDLAFSDAFIAKTFGALHSGQGYELMYEWGIPEIYCNVAMDHHKEDFDNEDVLLMSVRIANRACGARGVSTHPETAADLLTAPEVHALDIRGDVLDELETVIEDCILTESSL